MNAIATAPALSARLIPRFSDRELEVTDWGIENLAFRIESAQRELERFAAEAGLDEGEALSFLFENFDGVTDAEGLAHRLRIFNSELEARKR